MAKRTPYVPPRTDLEALVPEIVRVIGQSYAFLMWFTHVFPRLEKSEAGYGTILRNNLFEGTLLNLRKLNEFFKIDDAPRDDDARAYHFPGFKESVAFLSDSDLKEIHKRFAHLTYHGVKEGHGAWNMARAMKSALNASLPFLDYLIRDFYTGSKEKAELVMALRNCIPQVLGELDRRMAEEESQRTLSS